MVAIPADLSTAQGCEKLAVEAAEALAGHDGKLHVLVNNSGTSWGQVFDEYEDKGEVLRWPLDVKGAFHLVLTDELSVACRMGQSAGIEPQGCLHAYSGTPTAVTGGCLARRSEQVHPLFSLLLKPRILLILALPCCAE